MKKILSLTLLLIHTCLVFGQQLPPKLASPFNVKQIHSGHSLTDPLFGPWPGQYVDLVASENSTQGWQIFDQMVGKSTIPGSALRARWENPPGYNAPDARHQINNWELLSITERVPMAYEGGNTQQWYLDQIQEQKVYLSLFVNNAWNNGNNGDGTPTLLWTTWTNIDNSNGPWRQMLDIQGAEFERMQDYANANRVAGAPHVYIIPGHKMMARLYDDIQADSVPGIDHINEFFSDNIHTNSLGAYAIAMMHYACIFNLSPVGLPSNLLLNPPSGFEAPSDSLANYLQSMIWEVVTTYPRTGITESPLPVVFQGKLSAKQFKDDIQLQWSVATQINNEKYVVEHSADGKNFTSIGEIAGDGTSYEIKNYDFIHTAPSIGINYYRIKQIDVNGKYSYSDIASIRYDGNEETKIYPNPATSEVTINTTSPASLQIIDVQGKILSKQTISEGQNTINLAGLPKGVLIFMVGNQRFKVLNE